MAVHPVDLAARTRGNRGAVVMGRPTISVITAAYNAARFVEETLASIAAQTYPDLEMIVVDDGSTDDTRERVARFGSRVTLLTQPNGGVAAALNTGVRHARGAYITFLDADDAWVPRRLERVMSAFDADPAVAAVYHGYAGIDEAGRPIGEPFVPPPHGEVLEPLLCGLFVGQSMIALKRECFDRVGPFDTTLRTAPDWDLFLRVALAGYRFRRVPDALVRYRMHSHNLTRNLAGVMRDGRTILDRAFADPRLPDALRNDGVRSRAYGQLSISVAARYLQSNQWDEALSLLLEGVQRQPQILLRPGFYLDFAERSLPSAAEPATVHQARVDRAVTLLSDMLTKLLGLPDVPPAIVRNKRGAWSALCVAVAALQRRAGRRVATVSYLSRGLMLHPPTVVNALRRARAHRALSRSMPHPVPAGGIAKRT